MRSLLLPLLLLAAGWLSSCSPPAMKQTPAAKPATGPSPAFTAAAAAREGVRAELAAGRYQAALDRIEREIRHGRQESWFAAEYPAALNGLLESAGRLRQEARFDEAGRLLQRILDTWPKDPAIAGKINQDQAAIRKDMRQCADRLMEEGLIHYRAGRLEKALAAWQKVLDIEPGDAAARRAVDTISLQLKNLRSLK